MGLRDDGLRRRRLTLRCEWLDDQANITRAKRKEAPEFGGSIEASAVESWNNIVGEELDQPPVYRAGRREDTGREGRGHGPMCREGESEGIKGRSDPGPFIAAASISSSDLQTASSPTPTCYFLLGKRRFSSTTSPHPFPINTPIITKMDTCGRCTGGYSIRVCPGCAGNPIQ
ncbi:hypothetical protein BCR34DRAFT_316280 [Clohesyomyces aquaticus]|uniref:Uncharacterized protein n=1 Tax=Clohesyomyces aquaticus TaxID=1231657 RepID=A0A1Y1ZN84_9PLEO|nr:hypothetical protein BCR34DRAFT_316280 [Clohesyomyces aquaticus]